MYIDELQIGQRVGTSFSQSNRIFLAGDAVHTHSPKAGQGMNVSMQDSYNLGWKLALVAKGICKPSILSTYETERRQIAQDLIAFDHKFSRLFSGRPAKDVMDEEGVSMEEFKSVFQKGGLFAAGVSVEYEGSSLVDTVSSTELPNKDDASREKAAADAERQDKQHHPLIKPKNLFPLKLGMRFPSHTVVNQADARPWPFQHWLKSTGQFRIVLFAGNMASSSQRQRIQSFCSFLESTTSVIRRITPENIKLNTSRSPVEILTLHSAGRRDVELLRDFPEVLRPLEDGRGYDYYKVFCDDESYHEGKGFAYEGYGVDEEKGCVVVVRPDQYVGWIGEVEDTEGLNGYFEKIFVRG